MIGMLTKMWRSYTCFITHRKQCKGIETDVHHRTWRWKKSYRLHTIVRFLEFSSGIVQVTASSGSVAELIYDHILRSFLAFTVISKTNEIWRSIAATDTLIADEISGVSAKVFEKKKWTKFLEHVGRCYFVG